MRERIQTGDMTRGRSRPGDALAGLAIAAGAVTAVIGGGYLAAWLGGIMTYRGTTTITMKTNAALCLLLLGVALVQLVPERIGAGRRWIGRACALVALLVGGLTCVEHITGWDLGIDQVLAQEPLGAKGVFNPNRMGVPGAVGSTLGAMALLLLGRRRQRPWAVQGPALAICLIALLAVIGYLYSVPGLYGVARLTAIAWPTAGALMILGLGLLLARPHAGLMALITADDPGGMIVRRLLLLIVVLPVPLGWLRLAGERWGWYEFQMGTALLVLSFIVIFAVIIHYTGRQVSRSARALRQSEQRLRATFDHAGVGIVEVEGNDQFVAVNGRACDILGRTREQLLAMNVHELTWPDDRAVSDRLNGELHAGLRDRVDYEKRYIRGDGSPVWARVTVVPIRDRQGRWIRSITTIEDITERKRAEEALERSRALLSEAEKLSHTGAWEWDLSANRWTFSDEWLAIHGCAKRVLAPEELLAIAHPDDRAAIGRAFEDVRRGRSAYSMEHRIVRQDNGQVRVVRARGQFVRDAAGEVVRAYGFAQDITEQTAAEEALHRSQEVLSQAGRMAHLGAWDIEIANPDDVNASPLRWSDEVYRIFGYEPGRVEVDNNLFFGHVHPDDRERVVQAVAEAIARRGPYHVEHRVVRPDGQQCVVLEHAEITFDESGRPLRIVGAVQDITEQKRAEEALLESRRQLEALNQDLERRVAEQTEEVRRRATQLQALAAQLSRAEHQERKRLSQILHDHLQQLLVGAKFNLSIVQDQLPSDHLREATRQVDSLLDESLSASRSLTIELSPPVLYKGTFAAALHWLAGWMREKHRLEVEVDADEQANPAAEEIRVLLFQSVRELLFNVVKHARMSRAVVRLRRDGQDRVRILVADEGPGLDPRQRGPSGGGSGLGLFGIEERLELLGGRMEVDSSPGKGTRMTLVVPLCLAASPCPDVERIPAAMSASAEPFIEPAGMTGKIRVLLADDHAVVRDGLSRLLRNQPDVHVIGLAANGQEAVELALTLRPDVVVMDVSMPVLDGIGATQRITSGLPGTCVIGLSMHDDRAVESEMKAAGASGYLTKTSPPEELVAAVRGCVRNGRE